MAKLQQGDLVLVIKSNSLLPMKGEYAVILNIQEKFAEILLLGNRPWTRIHQNQKSGYHTCSDQLKLMYRSK
jgi:hypothetical protein